MNTDKIKEDIEDLHMVNMTFFKQKHPCIYKNILETKKNTSLTIDTRSLTLNKIINGKLAYPEGALQSAENEVNTFIEKIKSSNYKPAPSSINIKNLIKKNAFINTAKHYSRYFDKCTQRTPENTDLLIFGIGLGHHIKLLSESNTFNNITVIENDLSKLKESLYCINWKTLLEKNKNISLIINTNSNNNEFHHNLTNFLNKQYPSIIISTLIYNHLEEITNKNEYQQIKEKINNHCNLTKIEFEIAGPDTQRLLNSNYNIYSHKQILNLDKTQIGDNNSNIIIIGSGPSLDKYIDIIKTYRDKLFIISSGSSLTSLLKLDIRPDLHLELESQNLAALNLEYLNESFSLEDITLVCSASSNPKISKFFKNTYYFIQESSELTQYFPSKYILNSGGVTCTNGAAAFVSRISDGTIYLMGLDFAYTKNMHHAKDNISYQKNLKGDLKYLEENFISKANLETIDINNNKIMTTPVLNSAKEAMQELIIYSTNQFINCSFGAKIHGTTHHDPDQFISSLEKLNDNISNISFCNETTDNFNTHKILSDFYETSFNVCETIHEMISNSIENKNMNISILVNSILDAISKDYSNNHYQYRNIMSFNRLPLLTLSIISNYTDKTYRNEIVTTWLNDYKNYIEYVKNVIFTYLKNNDFPSTEDWIETNK